MADIKLSDELIELERSAWTEIQEGRLTLATAQTVQVAIAAHAEATEQRRIDVEAALKKKVRYPEDA